MDRITKKLRLLTYNIHNGVGRDRRYELERIARVLEAEAPDLVALQEVDKLLPRTNGDDQARALAEALGMHYLHCETCCLNGGAFGIAVLSRFPLVHNERYDITHVSSKEARY